MSNNKQNSADAGQAADEIAVLQVSALQFYRKAFRRSLAANIMLSGVAMTLVAALVVVKNKDVDRQYFAYDSRTGQMVQMQPLSRPNMSAPALLDWTMQCVERANSYDVVNYRQQLMDASSCFTVDGWNQFYKALEKSGNLHYVVENKMIASAVRSGPAIIVQEGINPVTGSYSYIIRFPLTISYQGVGRLPTQNLTMTIQVARVAPEISPDGVGIEQIIGE